MQQNKTVAGAIYSVAKRCFDIVMSALCLVVFSPLFLIFYILIKQI